MEILSHKHSFTHNLVMEKLRKWEDEPSSVSNFFKSRGLALCSFPVNIADSVINFVATPIKLCGFAAKHIIALFGKWGKEKAGSMPPEFTIKEVLWSAYKTAAFAYMAFVGPLLGVIVPNWAVVVYEAFGLVPRENYAQRLALQACLSLSQP